MKTTFTRTLSALLVATFLAAGVSSCYYDKEDLLYPSSAKDCSATPAKFGADVQPIIASKCATSGCHDKSTAAGAVVLETYAEISSKADRIRQRSIIDKTMPPGAPLSTTEIATLQCWIDNGIPNN